MVEGREIDGDLKEEEEGRELSEVIDLEEKTRASRTLLISTDSGASTSKNLLNLPR